MSKPIRRVRLILRALEKFSEDHGFFLSSAITFNLLICLIPFILLMLASVGRYLYGSREVLTYIRTYLEDVLPSSDPNIMGNILRVIRTRKIVGGLGIAGLIWTSTWVFSSIRTAFHGVFHEERERGFLHGKAIDLGMILLAGGFLLISISLNSAISYVQGSYYTAPLKPAIHLFLTYVASFFFSFWIFFLIYKIVPNKKIRFDTALKAASFTTILWEMARHLFGWYVIHLGRFSMVYGSLSALAVFFLWIYYSSAVLVLGGEVAFLLESGNTKRRRG